MCNHNIYETNRVNEDYEKKSAINFVDIARNSNVSVKNVTRLAAYIAGLKIEDLIFSKKDFFLTAYQLKTLMSYIARNKLGEPISKILHQRYFWKSLFFINNDVLDPRPETEFIVEYVKKKFDSKEKLYFLDCGTGSGCILLSILLEFSNSYGVGIDKSCGAIVVAEQNAQLLNIDNVNFINIDWNSFKSESKFDCIISNPPYIPSNEIEKLEKSVKCFDPILALDGGPSGVDLYHELFEFADNYLKNDGLLIFEIGIGQYVALTAIAQKKQYVIVNQINDYSEIIRIIVLKKQQSIFS